MALTFKHNFVSPIVDQADPNLLGPDEWNDDHATSMATNKLLGRATAGAGAIEEITLGTNLSYTGTTLNAAGGSPILPFGSVQFNNGGSFGGDAAFSVPSIGTVTLGDLASATRAQFEFIAEDGTKVTVQPLPATTNWTFSLPLDAGTNTYVLTTDGFGVTSWTAPGSTANLIVGTSTITGGTTKHVVYDDAGVVGEAANFTIESGNPNVTAGNAYLYGTSGIAIQADPATGNWFFGDAGNLTLTGADNVAIGSVAGVTITTGHGNVAVGTLALPNSTTGSGNVAMGSSTLHNCDTGGNNVCIGNNAGKRITSGSSNFCVGENTGIFITTGDANICFGAAAGQALTTAVSENTIIGYFAGPNVTTGNRNSLIGSQCGDPITTATNCIVIGALCEVPNATSNGQMSIGNYIYGTGLTSTGTTISTAKIGLGVKAPANELDVAGAISLTTFIEGTEMSAPAAPAANGFRIFAQDNGAGKTQLMVIFNTGAAQQLAIQP